MGQSVKKQCKLQEAIDDGEIALTDVAALLDSGLSANTKIGHATALHYAISKKRTRIAELLIEHGASVSSGYFTETPLHQAAAVGDVQILSSLLSRGAKINVKNHNGCTPLWYAVKGRHLGAAQYLLQQTDVDVDCPCDDTFLKSTALTTSLSLAVQNQDVDIVSLLLSKGADLNAADISGRTPLHHACQLKNLTIVEILVQHRCLLDVMDIHGYTPVHMAVCQDEYGIIRLLVQAGCDVNLGTLNGSRCHPLHTASERGNPEMVAILCTARHIDVNCRDRHQKTPLIVACRSGNIDCVQYLIGSGADVNVQDGNGLTVLSLALSLEEEPSLIWRLSGVQKKSRGHLGVGCHSYRGSGGCCHGDESGCGEDHCCDDESKFDGFCCHGGEANCDRESQGDKLCSSTQSRCRCSYSQGQENNECGMRDQRNHNHKKCFDAQESHHHTAHEVAENFEVDPLSPILPSTHLIGGRYGAQKINPLCHTSPSAQLRGGRCMAKRANTVTPSPERDLNQSTHLENVASTSGSTNHIPKRSSNITKASSLDVLHVLIQAGANLNLRDEYGKTALDYAFQVLKLQSACLLLCHGAALDKDTLISVMHASRIKLPPRKFIRPAVVALTLTSFDFWNCLHHFFYRADFFDDDDNCALTEIMLKLQQPMTLARQSRSVIRQTLMKNTHSSIAPLVRELPLPTALKQFLLLSDVVEIVASVRMIPVKLRAVRLEAQFGSAS